MGRPLTDEQIMRMYRMIKTGEYSGNQIAFEIGSCAATVRRYIKMLESGEDVPRVTEAKKNERKIMKMINAGISAEEIMRKMGCSEEYIDELTYKAAQTDVKQTPPGTKYEFLQEHWHFNPDYIYENRKTSEDGYRIVRKGQKGQLRTPYRPDRIFR